jgi:hypothetical protein
MRTNRTVTTTPAEFAADINALGAASDSHTAQLAAGLGLVFGPDPRSASGGAVWPAADRGIYVRVVNAATITKVGIEVAVQSGNVSVAVYRNTGTGPAAAPTGAPVASSGAVACPAVGFQEVALGASVVVAVGDWLFLSCDNGTASFLRHSTGVSQAYGLAHRQATAHPAPTVGALLATSYVPVLMGTP